MRKNSPKYMVGVARNLRRNETEAEKVLWEMFRDRRFHGLKFYRQCPIGRYVPDFLCNKLRLAIELDGLVHDMEDQVEYDNIRTGEIQARHITVLRIKNEDIINSLDQTLDTIASWMSPDKNPYIRKRPKPTEQTWAE